MRLKMPMFPLHISYFEINLPIFRNACCTLVYCQIYGLLITGLSKSALNLMLEYLLAVAW